jgi:hypothetical protein
MTSTADCKNFLAGFVKNNNSIVVSIFGEVIPDMIKDASNPKKWKRRYKCAPGKGLYEFDTYTIFDKNVTIKRMGYDGLSNKRPASDFVSERGFYLDPDVYDTGIGFVVLEDTEGNLHLGDYIGD